MELDKVAYDRLAVNYVAEDGQLRTRGSAASGDDVSQLGLFGSGEDDD